MAFGTTLQYQGYTLKSKVEFAWARHYFMEEFDWKYEPVRFQQGRTSYTPDFGLDENEIFTEIKVYGEKHFSNHYFLCPQPLILICGTPDRHYAYLKPAGKTQFLPKHTTFAQAYDLARKAIV